MSQDNTDSQIRDPNSVRIKRALISVSNKYGLEDFARRLEAYGVEIISTGGTSRALKEAGLKVRDISDVTGFPEIMDGRVKTLHPAVHGGILGRRDSDEHMAAMDENGIEPIDMVVVNLYPFEETVAGEADFTTCIENIDIGGPALIRAAAKNHNDVVIITDPQDYQPVTADMDENEGAVTHAMRRHLAANAFAMTAGYDAAIAHWFAGQSEESFPRRMSFSGNWAQTLRYGENPHQSAALYLDGTSRPGVATATKVQGKELSYNNLNDTDAAFELVAEFDDPACAIIKHANPCGVAIAGDTKAAYKAALACDPVSAFGGIIALNRPLNKDTAGEIIKLFCEVIIAPAIEAEAMEMLQGKENLRVLTTGTMPDMTARRWAVRTLSGGYLVQDYDTGRITQDDLKVVTEREPTRDELADMLFAFRVAKHVKSNAIVYARNNTTVGIGAGQMSRIDSTRIAARKAEDAAKAAALDTPLTKGSVVASDAFFPFPDGLLAAADAGATAIIQPGGSRRDDEVIAAADERGLAMVFTGMRHFRH